MGCVRARLRRLLRWNPPPNARAGLAVISMHAALLVAAVSGAARGFVLATIAAVGDKGAHAIRYRSTDRLNNTEAELELAVTIEGAPPPARETNWKPLVAAIFAAVLAMAGVGSARRAPSRAGPRPRLRAFALAALPFVVVEAGTGVVSLLTGLLAIPPLLGAGTAVDVGLLAAGLSVLALRVRAAQSAGSPSEGPLQRNS